MEVRPLTMWEKRRGSGLSTQPGETVEECIPGHEHRTTQYNMDTQRADFDVSGNRSCASSKSTRIKTPEELIEYLALDMDQWELERAVGWAQRILESRK